jgi:hypothetical protein
MAGGSLSKKVSCKQKHKGRKVVNHVAIWGKSVPDTGSRGKSRKARARWVCQKASVAGVKTRRKRVRDRA